MSNRIASRVSFDSKHPFKVVAPSGTRHFSNLWTAAHALVKSDGEATRSHIEWAGERWDYADCLQVISRPAPDTLKSIDAMMQSIDNVPHSHPDVM